MFDDVLLLVKQFELFNGLNLICQEALKLYSSQNEIVYSDYLTDSKNLSYNILFFIRRVQRIYCDGYAVLTT